MLSVCVCVCDHWPKENVTLSGYIYMHILELELTGENREPQLDKITSAHFTNCKPQSTKTAPDSLQNVQIQTSKREREKVSLCVCVGGGDNYKKGILHGPSISREDIPHEKRSLCTMKWWSQFHFYVYFSYVYSQEREREIHSHNVGRSRSQKSHKWNQHRFSLHSLSFLSFILSGYFHFIFSRNSLLFCTRKLISPCVCVCVCDDDDCGSSSGFIWSQINPIRTCPPSLHYFIEAHIHTKMFLCLLRQFRKCMNTNVSVTGDWTRFL